MKLKYIIPVAIILCIAISLVVRIVLPFDYIFTSNGTLLNTPDAYFMLRYADTYPNIPHKDYFYFFPAGTTAEVKRSVFPVLIGNMSNIFNMGTTTASAIISPILFAMLLIIVFFTAKALFNPTVGLIATAILAIMPGDILHRTMLGAGDSHSLEMVLLTLSMMFAILVFKNEDNRFKVIIYLACCGIINIVYWLSWPGAIISIFILAIAFAVWLISKYKLSFMTIMVANGFVFYMYIARMLSHRHIEQLFTQFGNMFVWDLNSAISEGMPLFFSYGVFDFSTSWSGMGIIFYLLLIGIGWIIYRYIRYRQYTDLLLITWTVIVLTMALAHRRYEYYLGINAAILSGYLIYKLIPYVAQTRSQYIKVAVIVTMLIVFPLQRASIVMANNCNSTSTQAWLETTDWLKQYGDYDKYLTGKKMDFSAMTSGNYGYLIVQRSHIPVVSCPGSHRPHVAKVLMAETDTGAIRNLDRSNVRFLITSSEMTTVGLYEFRKHIKRENFNLDKMLLFRLDRNENIEYLKLVFQSTDNTVKVYEYTKWKDS